MQNLIIKDKALRKVLKFTIPIMIMSVFQLAFNAVDTMIVGKFVGDKALAAVGSNSALTTTLIQLFVGLSIGTNIVVAKKIGENNSEETLNAINTSLLTSVVSGFLVMIIGLLFSYRFLKGMNSPFDIIDMANLYLKLYFLGTPLMMIGIFCSAVFRACGDTRTPMKCMLTGGIFNVIANFVTVVYFKWEVFGVGISTALSQVIICMLFVVSLHNKNFPYNVSFTKFNKKSFFEIVKIGLPSGIQGVILCLSSLLMQTSLNSLGSLVVAGDSAAYSLEGFVYAAMDSFSHTAISFTSQNLGAKNYSAFNRIFLNCLACSVFIGFIFGYGLWYFGDFFLRFYVEEEVSISAGIKHLSLVSKVYWVDGIANVSCGMVRGLGKSITPTVIGLLVCCVARVVWILVFFPKYPNQTTIYLPYLISWIILIFAYIFVYLLTVQKLKKNNA